MRPANTSYRSFLLRVWKTDDDTAVRSSATAIDTGETRVFNDVDALCCWLRSFAPRDVSRVEPTSPSRSHLDHS